MKSTWFAALMVSVALAAAPTLSDAKRLGSGKSSGLQRDMPARTAPDAPPAKPATPAQATPNTPANAAAAAPAAAAAGKRSWLGPIAGIAAAVGLVALMSHLGLSEAFGSFLLLALLAVAAIFLVRYFMRRRAAAMQPAMAGAGMNRVNSGAQVAWPAPAGAAPAATPAAAPLPPLNDAPSAAFVPASFDSEAFERIAKTIFVRLQAANDAGDVNDLRRFTTPEMFAELRMDLQDRAGQAQHTDVEHVDAKVLDVSEEADRQIVSVRFSGRVREAEGAEATPFDEVWHLVKPHDDGSSWLIAGIEQMARA